eukprot:55415_1
MSTVNKLKRKRKHNGNISYNSAPDPKRQKLEHTDDKPLRYLLLFTHTLIANYEEIMKDSWIRSIRYIIKETGKKQPNQHHTVLIQNITQFMNTLCVSTFVEDDLVDKLLKFVRSYQNKHNQQTLIINDDLKYNLMQIKDRFFEDNVHKIELIKGMRIFLRELKENLKWTLCLIHKDSRETYNLILNDIGLRGYFNAFVCAPSIANYNRPYKQLYEQSISRSRIFKQQCIVLSNHETEALESIHFGIFPILISKQNVTLNGKYFSVQYTEHWIDETLELLKTIKQTKHGQEEQIYALPHLVDNEKCFESKDVVRFMNDDGRIYDGIIDKLVIPSPVKIFRINFVDSQQNAQTCLKQLYLIWKVKPISSTHS